MAILQNNLPTLLRHRSQASLARDIGIHPTRVSEYVSGRVTPSLSRAFEIAHALDCSIHDIWTLED